MRPMCAKVVCCCRRLSANKRAPSARGIFSPLLRPHHGGPHGVSQGVGILPSDSITLQFFKSPLSGFETASQLERMTRQAAAAAFLGAQGDEPTAPAMVIIDLPLVVIDVRGTLERLATITKAGATRAWPLAWGRTVAGRSGRSETSLPKLYHGRWRLLSTVARVQNNVRLLLPAGRGLALLVVNWATATPRRNCVGAALSALLIGLGANAILKRVERHPPPSSAEANQQAAAARRHEGARPVARIGGSVHRQGGGSKPGAHRRSSSSERVQSKFD